jgi:hypothetical protein
MQHEKVQDSEKQDTQCNAFINELMTFSYFWYLDVLSTLLMPLMPSLLEQLL